MIPIRKKVKPGKEGLRVLDPFSMQPIPMEGKEVVWSRYWFRREKKGDIVVIEPQAEIEKVEKPIKKVVKKRTKKIDKGE